MILDSWWKYRQKQCIKKDINYVKLYSFYERRGDYKKNEYITKYLNVKYPAWKYGYILLGYRSRCWACKEPITEFTNIRCKECGWFICYKCGACKPGCRNGNKVLKNYNIEINIVENLPEHSKIKQKFLIVEKNKKELYYSRKNEYDKLLARNREKHEQKLKANEEREKKEREIQSEIEQREKEIKIKRQEELIAKEKEQLELKIKVKNEERIQKIRSIKVGTVLKHNKFGVLVVTYVGEDRIKVKEMETEDCQERRFLLIDIFLDSIQVIK